MKKVLSVILSLAAVAALASCGNSSSSSVVDSTTPSTGKDSAAYGEIIKSNREEAENEMAISGKDAEGNLIKVFNPNAEMDETSKNYYIFEGLKKHIIEANNLTLDENELYEISNKASIEATVDTDEARQQAGNDAVIAFLEEKAGVKLTDEEKAKIAEETLATQKVTMEESEKSMLAMELEALGLTAEDITNYALSTSMMNVRVYTVGIFMPAEGKTEIVKTALESHVAAKQKEFETYLADQFEIANQAKVEILPSGEVVIVMCPEQDKIFTAFETALK